MGYFSEGLAAAKIGERWGFINKKGETVIKPQFQDEPAPFFFGEAMVTIGGRKEYILKSSSPFAYAYSVEIPLKQEVSLGRKPNMRTAATTWSRGSVGMVGIANLRAIRETVRGRVDHFIHDYFAANSK